LVRFLLAVFPETVVIDGHAVQDFWIYLVSAMSVLSMVIGNVLALVQTNVKRLLAYSSIAQAGYALIGVAALQSQSDQGVASVAFYMFMYTFTNLLAFAVVVFFSEITGRDDIKDLAGLNRRSPMMALTMTIALLSLGGIPPAAGFFGKFFLFNAAVDAGLEWLAMVGVLNAIVALYYYLVVIKVMYVDHGEDEDQPLPIAQSAAWVLGITTVAVLILGVVPAAVFDWARDGAQALQSVAHILQSLVV
jgi:NADH-quinone oxidoreductase subunit N